MAHDWERRYEAAITVAQKAGANALSYFNKDIVVEWKADQSPVTLADQSSEEIIRQEISKNFPEDGFLGEEFGNQPGSSGYQWVIDPIDGTRNFIRGVPVWATLLGLKFHGEVIAGIAVIPAMSQTYHALKGHGSFRDGKQLHVSQIDSLKKATVVYTSITLFQQENREKQFLDLVAQCDRTRGFGDFYGFTLLAEGTVDVAIDSGVKEWDVCPLKVIVEEAGGMFSDWTGTPRIDVPQVLATNGLLHGEVLRIING
ncbi:histidinol-phosphatase [Telmatocola sphagniphila]|uniref:Histidinol-phosphatase n=1 Tax=Telmatocola sphagniphila TaxID=1123043 RepID=A0A8E6ETZ3_9BACT|nr:histidinol-phosphatase [Telmatocola sphagniphila]QVL33049.1 histidinol-phosphatase [Telmatocola sphagniphila]